MTRSRLSNKLIRELSTYARKHGWRSEMTRNGHVKFVKPGRQPVFLPGTPSDYRTAKNFKAELKRYDHVDQVSCDEEGR